MANRSNVSASKERCPLALIQGSSQAATTRSFNYGEMFASVGPRSPPGTPRAPVHRCAPVQLLIREALFQAELLIPLVLRDARRRGGELRKRAGEGLPPASGTTAPGRPRS